MRKNILIKTMVLIAIIAFSFSLTGCAKNYPQENAKYYEVQYLFLNEGETHEFDLKAIFKYSNIKISSFELKASDEEKVSLNKNTVKAISHGKTRISCHIKDSRNKTDYIADIALIFVVDQKNLIEIRTTEELAAINDNKECNFVLKADIDLKDWGDWMPIDDFKGTFTNPNGYIIRNLTISSAKNMFNDSYGGYGALFGKSRGYIEGIILENVYINLLDFDRQGMTIAGGIVGYNSGIIRNCRVQGEIAATTNVGGVTGVAIGGWIINCSFIGTIWLESSEGLPSEASGGLTGSGSAGGIAGYSYGVIRDCTTTNSQIRSSLIAGGIVGITALSRPIFNCTTTNNAVRASIWGIQIGHSMDRL